MKRLSERVACQWILSSATNLTTRMSRECQQHQNHPRPFHLTNLPRQKPSTEIHQWNHGYRNRRTNSQASPNRHDRVVYRIGGVSPITRQRKQVIRHMTLPQSSILEIGNIAMTFNIISTQATQPFAYRTTPFPLPFVNETKHIR